MVVFEKSSKGLEEVKTKAHGLSMIERRVLILVDGKRTVDDLKAMSRVPDLDNIIHLLQTGRYVNQLTGQDDSLAAHNGRSIEEKSPFRELPEVFQPEKFSMAQNFMTNTLNHFKGFYGATRLVRDIEACHTHEELRKFYDMWCQEIDNSSKGKKRMEELRASLLDVL